MYQGVCFRFLRRIPNGGREKLPATNPGKVGEESDSLIVAL